MKQKMLGLFLISLFTLSLVGFSYAYWYDELDLDGHIELGTFWGHMTWGGYRDSDDDIPGKDAADVYYTLEESTLEADGNYYDKCLSIRIGGPWVTEGGPWFEAPGGAYPGYWAWITWDMHWDGTVPSHVTVVRPDLSNYPWLRINVIVEPETTHPDFQPGKYPLDVFYDMMDRSQWHYCYWLYATFEIEIYESPDHVIDPPQDTTVNFDMIFNFRQYNLDMPPLPLPGDV